MYTPRHMRKRGNSSKNGSVDATKGKAFRKAALYSKRFISLSASELAKPSINKHYQEWCRRADSGSLRKGA